jgi:dimethylglycine dehydrogenase
MSLPTHTRALVIGGGVVGCSVLYHLAKAGWTDAVLLERKRLTAGSTWHAAAGFHVMNGDANMARLQAYTVSLYRDIQAMSGQDVGLHQVGGINIAATPERWDMLKNEAARHKVMGIETHLITPAEIARMCPIYDAAEILGGLYDPLEGYLDPYGATIAYAKCAKLLGASVREGIKVTAMVPLAGGGWRVTTDHGTIDAEHVVNAAGLWAREVGAMAGVDLPLIAMEHHYIITDALPELEALGREIPFMIDLDGGIYLRQEHKGVLLGVYEQASRPWALGGTPWDYGETDLLPPRMDDLVPELEVGFRRFAPVARAGLRRTVNGPFTFSPDGNPLVGPMPGAPHYWAACGVMAGFAQGGGVGLALAHWMVHGQPDSDIFAMDVARYGAHCTKSYVRRKAEEFYRRRFQIAFPNEAWPAGRPLKTSPVHAETRAAGAHFGCAFGLEQPAWFAGAGGDTTEHYSFRRSNAHDAIGAECRAARDGVGIWDAAFGKYAVSGPAAEAWLARLLAGRVPAAGEVRLAPMLREDGRLMGDLTVMRPDAGTWWIAGSYYLQTWHQRWFNAHLPETGVTLRNISDTTPTLVLIGPLARDVLRALGGDDCDNASLPFMAVRRMELAGAPAVVARVCLSGELSYELHADAAYLATIYRAAKAAGAAMGIRDIGYRAMQSMRLEKAFGIWSREYSADLTPGETGLDRFVDFRRGGFIGYDAAAGARGSKPARRLALLQVDADDADATGLEPLWDGARLAGYVTSGGFGHRIGRSLALAYIDAAIAPGTVLATDLRGERRSVVVLDGAAYDPGGARMRA